MPDRQIFALIIGINEYKSKSITNLGGCIADAEAMRGYLTEKEGVPPAHILMLTNGGATREAILQAFQEHLIRNDRIGSDDAMVFYFAGHGSRAKAPAGWTIDDGMVETISPHDESGTDEERPIVYGIMDRTLWGLFHELASVKQNNNITAILDCCHSGSGTRGEPGMTARGYQNRLTIPPELDSEIWVRTRKMRPIIPSGFRYSDMGSHVLLAACRQDEIAYEMKSTKSGVFTSALLRTLRQKSTPMTTYAGLMKMLPGLRYQHPQCEGDNKGCFLFTTNIPRKDTEFFVVQKAKESSEILIDAGSFQGVVQGTEFHLYAKRDLTSQMLGTLRAISTLPTNSVLAPRPQDTIFDLPFKSYAVVSRWANPDATLNVFFDDSTLSAALYETLSQVLTTEQMPKLGIARASSRSNTDIVLRDADLEGKVDVERTDVLIPYYANPRPHPDIPNDPDHVRHLFQSAAQFKFHLVRTNDAHPLADLVTVELYELRKSSGLHVITGENLFHDGKARIDVSDKPYGVILRNRSDHDLFPYLFYFDPSDYSIQRWYLPPSNTMLAPLRKESQLAVGHGKLNAYTIGFTLRPGELSDTGFLKLFLSTEYVDMTHVEQESVLDPPRGCKIVTERAKLEKDDLVSRTAVWDTTLSFVTVTTTGDDLQITRSRPPAPVNLKGTSTPSASLLYWGVLGLALMGIFSYFFFSYKPSFR